MKNTPFSTGVNNAMWFQFLNAVSFQIFLGTPMILYAKSIGASATVLGVISSLTPLLTIFQIPAAHQIPRFGYRRFFLAGWGLRNICVFAVVALPLMGFLDNAWKLGLLLALQVTFNLLRGITSGAWLPWITELVPEENRARYISQEQRLIQTGFLIALVFSGLVLKKNSTNWEYSTVFLMSALGGAASLLLLNRIPDVNLQRLKVSGTRVPWRAIVTFPPFARLVGFNLLYVLGVASVGVFVVSFLKGRAKFGEDQIILFNSAGYVAALLSLPTAGRLLDRLGSKKLLRYSLGLLVFCLGWWAAMAGGLLETTAVTIVTAYVIGGIAGSATNVSTLRLLMDTMPVMGRTHFFAFFSVITSLGLGITPIIWGICLDAMIGLKQPFGPFEWNRYSVYFVSLMSITIMTLLAVTILRESSSNQKLIPADALQ